jgi:hypothetical protein
MMGILNTEDSTAHDAAVTKARLAKQAEERRRAKEAELKRTVEAEVLHTALVDIVGELVNDVKNNFRDGNEPSASVRCSRGSYKATYKTIANAFYAVDDYSARAKREREQIVADINAIVELHDSDFVATCHNDYDGVYDPKDGLVGHTFAAVVIRLSPKPTES